MKTNVPNASLRFGRANPPRRLPFVSPKLWLQCAPANCYNFHDFRQLAKRRLPGPIFDYIDGAADDETTYRRNTESFEHCDLVPNVLRGVESIDISVTVMGQKLATPFYCSPTALQRLFHYDGERAVGAAAARFGTMFHKDRGLNRDMIERAKEPGVEVMMLTVDSITGGNRERDLRTGLPSRSRSRSEA